MKKLGKRGFALSVPIIVVSIIAALGGSLSLRFLFMDKTPLIIGGFFIILLLLKKR